MTGLAAIGARILGTRHLVRAPIWLYRIRAGALLGSRMLMLEHVGRSSGKRRYVVLEVVDHSSADRFIVASGFGVRAQWFRNIVADPDVRVWVGSRPPAAATARVLDQPTVDRVLADYAARHPASWGQFKTVLEATLGQPIGEVDVPLPMVELRLRS